jgi:hypothetical protein
MRVIFCAVHVGTTLKSRHTPQTSYAVLLVRRSREIPPRNKCPCSQAIPPVRFPVREQSHHYVSIFASNHTTSKCPCSRAIIPLLSVPVREQYHHCVFIFASNITTECLCSRAISPLSVYVREQYRHWVFMSPQFRGGGNTGSAPTALWKGAAAPGKRPLGGTSESDWASWRPVVCVPRKYRVSLGTSFLENCVGNWAELNNFEPLIVWVAQL